MKEVTKGFTAFFSAFGFIFSHGLAAWYLVPIALYILLVVLLAFSLINWLDPILSSHLADWLDLDMASNGNGFWSKAWSLISAGLAIAASIAMKILIAYLLGRVMKYVILIITSPLLAYLSEKAEEIITGNTYPFNLAQFLKDILRGILITLRNLFLELIFIGIGFVISFFVPLLTPFVTIALYMLNCYFMGFSMFDYMAERKKMGIGQSVQYMRRNMGRVFGLGLAFNLISIIPFADWVIAPVNGAIGAVIADTEAKSQ